MTPEAPRRPQHPRRAFSRSPKFAVTDRGAPACGSSSRCTLGAQGDFRIGCASAEDVDRRSTLFFARFSAHARLRSTPLHGHVGTVTLLRSRFRLVPVLPAPL